MSMSLICFFVSTLGLQTFVVRGTEQLLAVGLALAGKHEKQEAPMES